MNLLVAAATLQLWNGLGVQPAEEAIPNAGPFAAVVVVEAYGSANAHLGRATGVAISQERVATASHVLLGAKRLMINLGAEGMVEARVWNADVERDIAILTAKLPTTIHPLSLDLHQAHAGDSLSVIRRDDDGVGKRVACTLIRERHDAVFDFGSRYCLNFGGLGGDSGSPVLTSDDHVVAIITDSWSNDRAAGSLASPATVIPELDSRGSESTLEQWNIASGTTACEQTRGLWEDARRAVDAEQMKVAMSKLESIIVIRPNDYKARAVLAQCCDALHDEACCERTMADWKENGVRLDLWRLTRARLAVNRSAPQEAIAELRELTEDQQSSASMELLGTAKSKLGDFDGAEEAFKKALTLAPNDPEGWRGLVKAQRKSHRADDALASARKWAAVDWTEIPLLLEGELLNEKGDSEGAVLAFQGAKERNPNSSSAYQFTGWIYALRKDYDKAIPELKKAHELSPDDAHATIELAKVYVSAGRVSDAKSLLESMPRNDRTDNEVFSLLAVICHNLKDDEGLERALGVLKSVNPFEYNRLKEVFKK